MIFLRTIERVVDVAEGSGFPFDVPALHSFRKLEFASPVSFFAGENGTGKSTLLEAIGLRAKMKCVAGQPLEHDPAMVPVHPLARSLRLGWSLPTRYGFFLRVEDFFVHARENRARAEPRGPVVVNIIPGGDVRTGVRPSQSETDLTLRQSPGESFLDFLKERCVGGGLHLIDGPEAALSAQRQLEFMKFVKSVADENAQFIISTHSPILLAYPGAKIFSFDGASITPSPYGELAPVKFARNFIRDPEAYLHDM